VSIVKNLIVTSLGLDNERNDILWAFTDPQASLAYEVWVERSGAVSGPFQLIAKTYNAVSYTDWYKRHDEWSRYFYRLKVMRRKDMSVAEISPEASNEMQPDLVLAEIRRRGNLLLKEFNGSPVLYYPVRTDGTRCPDCWDDLARQRSRSHCKTCFDTGYVAGYYNPVLMYVNIHEDQSQIAQNPETDEMLVRPATAAVPGALTVQFGDLLLERTNIRWTVADIDRTEKLRVKATQHLRLHQIPETDIKYRVPLPQVDTFDQIELNREYSRPYTLNP
jgi:hypothetical protein